MQQDLPANKLGNYFWTKDYSAFRNNTVPNLFIQALSKNFINPVEELQSATSPTSKKDQMDKQKYKYQKIPFLFTLSGGRAECIT